MTDFFNRYPADTYKSVINIGTEPNETLDVTLKPLEDGRGNQSALKVSTTTISVGNVKIKNDNTIKGAVMDGGTF